MRFRGKNVLVTGSSRGIGAEIAKSLAGFGLRVWVNYRSGADGAKAVLEEIKANGGDGKVIGFDVTDEKAFSSAIKEIVKEDGELAYLVNNAGITRDKLALRMKVEDFMSVIDANLKSTFIGCREALKVMSKKRFGAVVNISSIVGESGNAGQTNYSASKGGVIAMSKSFAMESAPRGIRFNTVTPGFIATEMTDVLKDEVKSAFISKIPLGRFGEPREVAEAVAFLFERPLLIHYGGDPQSKWWNANVMYRVLILEDDRLFNETLEDFLDEEGYEVEVALDPYTALELTYLSRFDLYLFDVNLPYESGFSLLQKLRESGDMTPTIFLTSRNDKASLIEGFGRGADDYMRKPIDLDELLLRIKALLRRQIRRETIEIDDYILDCNAKRLYFRGKPLALTTKAIELLLLLLSANGGVVSLKEIEDRLWHTSEEMSLGSIRVYINMLKRYFPSNIENIRGIGYRFNL